MDGMDAFACGAGDCGDRSGIDIWNYANGQGAAGNRRGCHRQSPAQQQINAMADFIAIDRGRDFHVDAGVALSLKFAIVRPILFHSIPRVYYENFGAGQTCDRL